MPAYPRRDQARGPYATEASVRAALGDAAN